MVTTLMEIVGFVLVVIGLGLWSVPLAVSMAGVMMIAAGIVLGRE